MSHISFLFLSSAFHFSSNDPHTLNDETSWKQVICLGRLLSAVDDLVATVIQNRIANDEAQANTVCLWNGISCEAGQVTGILWRSAEFLCNVNWLPPTAHSVCLAHSLATCSSRAVLKTRRLPRSLRDCRIIGYGLGGSVDLRTLPEELEILSLPKNNFYGTVHLTNLPPSLKTLSFLHNNIEKVIVRNASLPRNLENAGFCERRIRSVKFVCLDENKVDPRVNDRWEDPYGTLQEDEWLDGGFRFADKYKKNT